MGWKPFKNIVKVVANVATGGIYGAVQGAQQVASGHTAAGLGQILATGGAFGNVAQPTIGTRNTLLIEAAVASAALGPTVAAIAGPAAGVVAATGKQGVNSIINTLSPADPVSVAIPGATPAPYYLPGRSSIYAAYDPGSVFPIDNAPTEAPTSTALIPGPLPIPPLVLAGLGTVLLVFLYTRKHHHA